jgi:hypothetical protein
MIDVLPIVYKTAFLLISMNCIRIFNYLSNTIAICPKKKQVQNFVNNVRAKKNQFFLPNNHLVWNLLNMKYYSMLSQIVKSPLLFIPSAAKKKKPSAM